MFSKKVTLTALAGLMIVALVTGCAAAAIPTVSAQGQTPVAPGSIGHVITVVGQGSVTGQPDIATAQIGVETQSNSLQEATRLNNEQVTQLLAALKKAGVAEKDIQTAYYSVYTEQRYRPETGEATGEVVYHANSTVSVTLRDLSKVGAMLDAAVAAGANNINGVSFSVADTTQLEAAARDKAVTDARARATDLARLFNVELGDVVSVSEVVSASPLPVYDRAVSGMGGGGAPIEPGQLTYSTQLQVTFNIK